MTLLPGLLVVLVAGCHAQYPAHTYALPQPVHYIPVVPYYQPQQPIHNIPVVPYNQHKPQVYTAIVETSGILRQIIIVLEYAQGVPDNTLFCVQRPIHQVWKQLLKQVGTVFVRLRWRVGQEKVRSSELFLSQVNLRIQT